MWVGDEESHPFRRPGSVCRPGSEPPPDPEGPRARARGAEAGDAARGRAEARRALRSTRVGVRPARARRLRVHGRRRSRGRARRDHRSETRGRAPRRSGAEVPGRVGAPPCRRSARADAHALRRGVARSRPRLDRAERDRAAAHAPLVDRTPRRVEARRGRPREDLPHGGDDRRLARGSRAARGGARGDLGARRARGSRARDPVARRPCGGVALRGVARDLDLSRAGVPHALGARPRRSRVLRPRPGDREPRETVEPRGDPRPRAPDGDREARASARRDPGLAARAVGARPRLRRGRVEAVGAEGRGPARDRVQRRRAARAARRDEGVVRGPEPDLRPGLLPRRFLRFDLADEDRRAARRSSTRSCAPRSRRCHRRRVST